MDRSEDPDECRIEKNWLRLLERAEGAEPTHPASAGTPRRSVVVARPPQEGCEVEQRWTELLSRAYETARDPDLPK